MPKPEPTTELLSIVSEAVEEGSSALKLTYRDWPSWREQLIEHLKQHPNEPVLILCDRPAPLNIAKSLLRGRKVSRPPTHGRIVGHLTEAGWKHTGSLAIWPSADVCRVAYPLEARAVGTALQHTGVIGGGGRRLWLRALLRSRLASRANRHLIPAVAVSGLPAGA
jgi:hypothetical protein